MKGICISTVFDGKKLLGWFESGAGIRERCVLSLHKWLRGAVTVRRIVRSGYYFMHMTFSCLRSQDILHAMMV